MQATATANMQLQRAAQENGALAALNDMLADEQHVAPQHIPRPVSQASSTRGPLKTSSLNMADRGGPATSVAVAGSPSAQPQHAPGLRPGGKASTLSSAAKGGVVDLRKHPPLPPQQQQPAPGRTFLKSLQASMPREVGLLTGARRGSMMERAPLPGVAEETASVLVATEATPPAAQQQDSMAHPPAHAEQGAAGQQKEQAHSPQRQRWSALYQYFVGKPAGGAAASGRALNAHQTPALQPPTHALPPPAIVQAPAQPVHASQPVAQAQPATKSPPYYTPPAANSELTQSAAQQGSNARTREHTSLQTQPQRSQKQPAWLAGNTGLSAGAQAAQPQPPAAQYRQQQHVYAPQVSQLASRPGALHRSAAQRNTSEFAPPNLAPSAPPGVPNSPSGFSRDVSAAGGTSGVPSPQPFAHAPAPGQGAVFPVQGGGAAMPAGGQVAAHRFAQRWQQMAQKSQDTLQAAQQATPAEAKAMLQRVTTLQRHQRASAISRIRD